MKINEIFNNKDFIQLPKLTVGDTLLIGKFKNRKAIIKGFKKDDYNQPVAVTDKGDQKLLKPRIPKLYESSSFQSWFKGSKIVDNQGKPLPVYHGTWAKFSRFDKSKIGLRDAGFYGTGFYFTQDFSSADEYAWNKAAKRKR